MDWMFLSIGDKVFHCWMTAGTNDLSNKDVLRGRVKQLSCICKTGPGFDSTSPEISKIYLSQTKLNISRNTHQYNIYILVSNYRCRYHIFNSWSNAWEKLILNKKRLKKSHDLLWNSPMEASPIVKSLLIWQI